ncbi:TIGR01906 family membrane protein [Streptococcus moroccensis]|uniref:TIGR01906 family membrane protein n=1 Tax=Streptococcus moroccensis TaxID=1451356 RepID=UPI00351FFB5B
MKTKLSLALTFLCLLALAIVLTISIAWLLYPLEIEWLGLESLVTLDSETIQHNFNVLLNYLTNPFQWTLAMPDFPSSADGLYHFEAVKKLFHLAQGLFLMTLLPSVLFLKKAHKSGTKGLLNKWFALMAVTPIAIGCFAGMIGFSRFFVLFHQILFPGDSTWLFHPSLDPVILILPERYFLHCFLLFFVLYECLAIAGYLWTKPKQFKKRNNEFFKTPKNDKKI